MLRKTITIRKNRTTISLILVIMGITLILATELIRYVGLSNISILTGLQKTFVYALILIGFLLACTKKHFKMEKSGSYLLFFSLITIISTFFGVKPDILFSRQAIHLMLFVSVFWTMYIATEQFGKSGSVGLLKFSYIFIAVLYFISIFTGKKIEGNMVYYLLMFLPFTSMINSKILRKILYLLQVAAVLISNKRTALIALVCYLVCFEWMNNKYVSRKKKVCKAVILILLLVALYIAFPVICEKLNITVFNELRLSHIEEDGGSNRLFIYGQLWKAQKNAGLIHWGIGSGYNSVLLSKICTDGILGEFVSAHNDFLEVLYDYGIIGLFSYISFFVCMFKTATKMKKDDYKYRIPLICSIIMVLFISLTSHLIIYLNYYAITFAFWALCLADYRYGERNE